MKRLIQLNLLLLLISSATAQDSQPQKPSPQQPTKILRVYDWNDLAQQHHFSGGEVISMDGMSVLKVENTNDAALEISLLKISDSPLIAQNIFLSCQVKYENVHGNGSLSLYCWQPGGSPLSDITGGPSLIINGMNGKMGDITGTSGWRTCLFRVDDMSGGLPTRLEMHLSLLGHGTVYLQPIKLMGMVGSWWSPQQIGMIGGIGGSVIGCFGALLGVLASKGRARNFVLITMKIFIALGILLTIAGLVAVVCKQRYAVWYPLLLPGVILTLVFSLNLPSIQRRYDELEIRRMTSIDAMGS